MEPSEILRNVEHTAGWLRKVAAGFKPETAIIAGSGLGGALPKLDDKMAVSYKDIPGFPTTTVKGHAGELIFGRMGGHDVVMMKGRFHYYEGRPLSFIAFPIRVLRALGVKNLLLTAAVGSLKPGIKVIAPWREWDLLSREKLLAYAEQHGIPVEMKHKAGGSPYSMDANLLHISYEGRHLENPAAEAEESMWRWTVSPEAAPDAAEYLDLEFAQGDLVAINGKQMPAHELLATLNQIGGKHGIGRLDLVENRYVGMKSRGCYETPGGTILLKAHRAIESITLDREVAHLKDDLMPRYASLVYNGYWWAPERKALQTLIDHTQQTVNGTVRLKLYKGNVIVVGRDSKTDSLFDPTIATFEDDAGAYDQKDAGGFIKLNALRMRIAANLKARKG